MPSWIKILFEVDIYLRLFLGACNIYIYIFGNPGCPDQLIFFLPYFTNP